LKLKLEIFLRILKHQNLQSKKKKNKISAINSLFYSCSNDEQQTRRQAQISMFSATWPKSIKTLAEDYLTNYVHATVGCLSESHAVNLQIQQIVDFCPNEQQKKQNLFKVLDEVCAYAPDRKTIIFVRTRDKVNRLSKELEQNGYKALLLHGSKSQQMRNEVLKEFRETPNALLLATDVASRGLGNWIFI